MTAVLIVNDQSLQRLGLRMLLAAEPGLTTVGEAADGPGAVRLSAELRPDVVLMDSRVPQRDGMDTIRRVIRPETPPQASDRAPRVLLLTPTGDDAYAYSALRAGAAGFLPHDATPDELTSALRNVAAGNAVITRSLTRKLIDAVRRQSPAHPLGGAMRLDALTERERDVLTAIASGWSNAEIATRLSIAPTTVKSHVSHILTKIGARARVQAVVFAYESGLVRPA
ncbi:response regulator transcription factor [Streptomyces griseus]|uniref:LuxR C-terminal-related transcriptional regulator n=1 Tax=Streptomyces griseus TaxID=1911 RepID=UPI00055FC5C8|nr:response regulator transcription factor [Streptomyces griseus]